MVNEALPDQNQLQKEVGNTWLVRRLSKNEFWICIGWIILEVTYGKKWYRLLGWTYIYDHGKATCKIKRDICGKTYLLKVSCLLYHLNHCSFFHLTILSYIDLSIYYMFLWVINSVYFKGLWCLLHKVQGIQYLMTI